MKHFKGNIILIIIVLFSFLGIIGCGPQKNKNIIKIGILQFQNSDWMNTVKKGFLDGLNEDGLKMGKDFTVDEQIANEDVLTANQIADKFVNENVNLIFAISTPAAQACANKTKTIPIVFGAITDPVSAKLVKSEASSGTNLTGTCDRWPVETQLKYFKEINPRFKKLGIIHNPGEDNSVFVMNQVKAAVKNLGYDLITATATNVSEVYTAARSIGNKCDGIYVAASNIVIQGVPAIIKVCKENHIPIISGEPSSVEKGAILTYSINYYSIGKLSADLAVKILKDGKNPSEIPVVIPFNYDLIINKKAADEYKIHLPKELLDKANKVID